MAWASPSSPAARVWSLSSVRSQSSPMDDTAQTLSDLLKEGLDVVFVGINPSVFSVARGHYFARSTNRFWPSLSRSVLSLTARQALGVETLGPHHDRALQAHGIGFTDVVKRATPKASDVAASEFAAGVQHLLAKLDAYRPRIACFHGITGYRPVHRVLTSAEMTIVLGLQKWHLGSTRIYLVPNPSGANAHFTPRTRRAGTIAWRRASDSSNPRQPRLRRRWPLRCRNVGFVAAAIAARPVRNATGTPRSRPGPACRPRP